MNSTSKSVFRNICKGDGRGAYLAARTSAHCKYDPAVPRTPRTPHSPFSEKGFEGYSYDNERRCPMRRGPAIAVHILVFFAYSTLLAVLIMAAVRQPDPEQCIMYESPAKNLVDYKIEKSDQQVLGDRYAGYPRPELEAAWGELLDQTNVRLTRAEVKAIDPERLEDAVALPDGGFVGTLNVFHELHCVRYLHTQLYQDEYYPGLNSTTREDLREHTEHCLTQLRRAALCHADVGVVTYAWDAESLAPVPHSEYQCADIEPLLEWTKERSVDLQQPNYIVHPSLGDVFPETQSNDDFAIVKAGLTAIKGNTGFLR